MDTCPMCSCLITDDICVMCGYKIKSINNQYNKNRSVFDIFDFIDGKNSYSDNENINTYSNTLNKIKNKNYIPNKNNSYEKNTYKKSTYSQVKYDKNLKQSSLENNSIDKPSQVSHSKPKNTFNNKTKAKNKFNFFLIISIILFLIQPSLAIFIFILRSVIDGTNKNKNKK